MNHVGILDCTLRDGAYLIDKNFGEQIIRGIICGLVNSGIEFVEMGFLQDEGFGEGKTVFKNSEDAKRYIPSNSEKTHFCLLADYSRYSIENLDQCQDGGVDVVRECFFKHERNEALKVCRKIKEKGYKLFVQPVDILGYTDKELIEFIEEINQIEPYCFSIVDTFGSMYQEDLHRLFELVNHNLVSTSKIGFHSHNNLQMSSALSQEFVRMSVSKREVIVDSTLSGMGRGAGNTPTELAVQYLVTKWGADYNIDNLLDVIGDYIDHIRSRCDWGYSTQYFIAGNYSAHVNNIAFLQEKNNIRYKDIRYILNMIGSQERKRYNYELLEKTYMELMKSDIDDGDTIHELYKELSGKKILLIAPGSSVNKYKDSLVSYINKEKPIIITVNFVLDWIKEDYVFVSSLRRISKIPDDGEHQFIYTSNVSEEHRHKNNHVISFVKYAKRGFENMDNAMMLCLRLMNELNIAEAIIAGFDGYDYSKGGHSNYALPSYEIASVSVKPEERNEQIKKMLIDFNTIKEFQISFITPSRFEYIFG